MGQGDGRTDNTREAVWAISLLGVQPHNKLLS